MEEETLKLFNAELTDKRKHSILGYLLKNVENLKT